MFKREMKINLKSFIIWSSILIGMFLIVFAVYPYIVDGGNIAEISKMMELFPEEILKAFNMDLASLDSAFGWLKSEGFVFVILIIGAYSGILGSNILLKEESDKTIEYLNSLPITRNKIVFSRIICGLIYITLMILALGLFNYFGLLFSGSFDSKTFILLSITPLFSSFVIFSLCMFLGTFTHKSKKMFGISLGIVFVSYILQTLSTISEKIEFLKYLSPFTLSDIRNVIIDSKINPIMIIISLALTCLFIILTVVNYNKKELV